VVAKLYRLISIDRGDFNVIRSVLSLPILIVSLFVISGCGSSNEFGVTPVPASGSVLVDGKPVAGLTVELNPTFKWPNEKMPFPQGRTDADGKFKLGTFSPDDGAIPGDYQIAVKTDSSEGLGKITAPIGMQYADASTSGLKATIRNEATEIPSLNLKPNNVEQKVQKSIPKR
jgi:hypothetical protein